MKRFFVIPTIALVAALGLNAPTPAEASSRDVLGALAGGVIIGAIIAKQKKKAEENIVTQDHYHNDGLGRNHYHSSSQDTHHHHRHRGHRGNSNQYFKF